MSEQVVTPQVTIYESLEELYPQIAEKQERVYGRASSIRAMGVYIYEGYFGSTDRYVRTVYQNIEPLHYTDSLYGFSPMNTKKLYLCIAMGRARDFVRIAKHKKVWGGFHNGEVTGFHLGYEYEFPDEYESLAFGSVALIDKSSILQALKLVWRLKSRCFIYGTDNDDLTEEAETRRLFKMLMCESDSSCNRDEFEYSELIAAMNAGDFIIKMEKDNMLRTILIQKQ
ncbi:MAG: hypothetical protein LBU31_00415 [Coriobacteriales bacterium]|jgi:hypothetical protein|nr:hypothetical protein [Coriobacteriales bacterium]